MYVLNVPQWKWMVICIVLVICGLTQPMLGNILLSVLGLRWAIRVINAENLKGIEKIVTFYSIVIVFYFATLSGENLIMVALYGFAMGIATAEETPLIAW